MISGVQILNIAMPEGLAGSTAMRLGITLAILAVGFIFARLTYKIIYTLRRRSLKDKEVAEKLIKGKKTPEKTVEYIIIIASILLSLVYLNAPVTNVLFSKVIKFLPKLVSSLLIAILGFIIVKISVSALSNVFETLRVRKYIKEIGVSEKLFDALMLGVKIFLYIVVAEIAVTQLGISTTVLENTLNAASYAIVFLLAFLGFFGFKDLVQNYAAGIYLRSSGTIKPGERVKIKDESGEIRSISAFGSTIATDSGYFMLIPNRTLMEKEVMFKRTKAEVETLEDIKDHFTAQKPSYCGPASAAMSLAMFGFDISQDELGEKAGTKEGEGTEREDLKQAIEEVTQDKVRAEYVPFDKISNLKDELKAWFNDGGLAILQFKKSVIFPDATTGHYVLCVGVEGNEILVVDPNAKTGGVYYVDHHDMLKAMGNYDIKRGYLVVAPKGTTAYWRLKEELVYSNPHLYDKISKSLEVQLEKILRRSRILKSVFPSAVDDFIEKWRSEDKVNRMWRPQTEGKDKGRRSLDEFTDNQ